MPLDEAMQNSVIPIKCKQKVVMKTSITAYEQLREALWFQVTGRSCVIEILKREALFHKY
jgi:hypothetical protein